MSINSAHTEIMPLFNLYFETISDLQKLCKESTQELPQTLHLAALNGDIYYQEHSSKLRNECYPLNSRLNPHFTDFSLVSQDPTCDRTLCVVTTAS